MEWQTVLDDMRSKKVRAVKWRIRELAKKVGLEAKRFHDRWYFVRGRSLQVPYDGLPDAEAIAHLRGLIGASCC